MPSFLLHHPFIACAHTITALNKPGDKIPELVPTDGEASITNLDKIRHASGAVTTAAMRLEMQKTMQTHAAVFRTGPVLQEGVTKMGNLFKQFVCQLSLFSRSSFIRSAIYPSQADPTCYTCVEL
jgi:succinate dehydrogenase/fumarate reductase flavoprotein subunit